TIDFGPATTSLISEGDADLFLTKWSTTGDLQQSGQIAGPDRISIAGFTVDRSDRPVLYGIFGGTSDMDPSSDTVLRSSIGVQDDYILRLDASGHFSDFYQMPRSSSIPRDLTTDRYDNIYATGSVHTTIAMPTGQQLQNADGGYDAYVLKLAMTPGISLRSSLGLATSENGPAATFGVVLDTPPTADVTISVASSDTSEGSVSPGSITFTPTNWNVPQWISVNGVDDIFTDGDQPFSVVLGQATSADPNYNALQPPAVSLVNQDDDRTIATFTRTDTRSIPDRGKITSDLTVPAAGTLLDVDVRVNIEHSWNEDLDVYLIAPDGTRIELFTDVGGFSQNFTNTILDASATSGIAAGSAPFTGRFRPEGNLNLLNGKQQQGTWKLEITDDSRSDTGRLIDWSLTTTSYIPLPPAGVTVTPTSGLVTSEGGTAASFSVVLASPPAADVSIPVSSSDLTEATVSVNNLIFTSTNWNVPQTVIVTGVDDSIGDGDITYSIRLGAAVSDDSRYNGYQPASVSATNRDDDAPVLVTKFYVVNDGTTDATFEYAATGGSVENYLINSGNSKPRGAASNVAGDKLWVVDSSRQVYVYNDRGAVLGAWTAGSISRSGAPEGISVSGNDVWIVDNASDKVFRYSGGASRVSGSQNAISSFSLNSANRNPKDLVTDGTNIWVVNDGTTDVVFKYTLSGSLVGSWTIGSANASPTGITLDPTGASQSLWIVDSGTDRVYEYANARSKTSGSLTASVSFALAAGNTNPQGIADPPPASFAAPSGQAQAAPLSFAAATNNRTGVTDTPVATMNDSTGESLTPARSEPQSAAVQVDWLSAADRQSDHFSEEDLFGPVDGELLLLLTSARRT
ncbi:MAG: proprotein convertase P-domain-containing protein, partial [Aureliella sp.]